MPANKASPALDTDNQVVACLGDGRTALERRPLPRPEAGEILLKMRVVGFCGSDLFKLETGGALPGSVLGHELIGEVIATGGGVTRFSDGDRVVVPHHVPCGECLLCRHGNETMCDTFRVNLLEPGGFADNVLVRRRAAELAAHHVPDHLADEAAVFMEPAACVLRGVRRGDVAAGGAAVVLGAGSMGLLHLLVLAAARPGCSVTVVDPLPERRALAERLGAARTAALGVPAHDKVMASTDGIGADAVFDTVGGGEALSAALALTRQGGSVVLFAHASEGKPAGFDLNTLFKYERRILGTYSAALKEQAEVFELLTSGALDPSPLVTHTMPLDDFADGVALVRKHQALKVLFTPSRGAAGV